MTSAGMMDCKKALTEAEGDFKRAVEILREKGKSTLAKRGDNETTQGAVLSRVKGGKAILVCLGCETDFVAATPDFKALAASIADAAIAEFPADLAALKAVKTNTGYTLDEDITNQAGKTGEKHVLAYYACLEAPFVTEYVHFNGKLGAIVAFNKEVPASIARGIAMQVASMNPGPSPSRRPRTSRSRRPLTPPSRRPVSTPPTWTAKITSSPTPPRVG